MSKNLYIDASHPNETRVVLKSDDNIEDYEYESVNNSLIKNNIYLGKVSRIEPSLQAAFVDFGRERHGFLSFNDIQSDYYQIPQNDLEKIKKEEEKVREELIKEDEKTEQNIINNNQDATDTNNTEIINQYFICQMNVSIFYKLTYLTRGHFRIGCRVVNKTYLLEEDVCFNTKVFYCLDIAFSLISISKVFTKI